MYPNKYDPLKHRPTNWKPGTSQNNEVRNQLFQIRMHSQITFSHPVSVEKNGVFFFSGKYSQSFLFISDQLIMPYLDEKRYISLRKTHKQMCLSPRN